MGWLTAFLLFFLFLRIMFRGYGKELSNRAQWIFAGILFLLFVIAAYVDYISRQ